MVSLIGSGPQAELGFLLQRLGDITAGEPVPRVVVIEGAAGMGKTRIVRELYRSLREDQATNTRLEGYWPALREDVVLTPNGGPDISEMNKRRRTLGPPAGGFQRAPNTLPSFFWWTITCRSDNDRSLMEVSAELNPQVMAHLPYMVEQRISALSPEQHARLAMREAPSAVLASLKGLKGDIVIETIGQALSAVDYALPGTGTALTKMSQGAVRLWRARDRHQQVTAGRSVQIQDTGAARLVEHLSRVVGPWMPAVLAVEDAHLMGPGLADLLDLLAQPVAQFPVMVVATAWPTDTGNTYRRWLEAEISDGLLEVRPCPQLSRDERIELAGQFSRTRERLSEVCDVYANPLQLTNVMATPGIGDRIRQGLPPEATKVPLEMRDLHRDRYLSLKGAQQQVLMVASALGPGPVMLPGVLHVCADRWLDPAGALGYAAADLLAEGWLTPVDTRGQLVDFDDPVVAALVADYTEETFDDQRGAEAETAYTRWVREWLVSNADDPAAFNRPEVRALARRYLDSLGPHSDVDRAVLRVAVNTLAAAHAAVLENQAAVAVWDRWRDPHDIDWNDPIDLSEMHTLAVWVRSAGDLNRAINTLQQVLEHRDEVLGRRNEQTRQARWDLAQWHAQKSDHGQAISLAQALREDQESTIGPDHPDTLTTRHNIASWTGEAGHPDQALTLYSALLPDRQRILGPDHPDTLRTRHNIAAWSKCLRLLESPRIDPDTPNAYLEVAISRTTYPEATAVLIAGCRRFGTHAMAAAAQSWDGRAQAAWLLLVDSGYDPWQMTLYWQHPGAALAAAVTAVDETDEEDLLLILQLNPQIEQTHGTALRLLAGLNPDLPHDLQPVTASLTYIATWVAPNTPLADHALAIRDHLAER
jgi:hypothetical protein